MTPGGRVSHRRYGNVIRTDLAWSVQEAVEIAAAEELLCSSRGESYRGVFSWRAPKSIAGPLDVWPSGWGEESFDHVIEVDHGKLLAHYSRNFGLVWSVTDFQPRELPTELAEWLGG